MLLARFASSIFCGTLQLGKSEVEVKVTKKLIIILAISLLAGHGVAQQPPTSDKVQQRTIIKTLKDGESYAMGVEILRNLQRQGFDFDLNMVIKGMQDAFDGGKLALSEQEILDRLNQSASETRVRRTNNQLVEGRDNRRAEEEFFNNNLKDPGVVSLPSGLQYKPMKTGDGQKPSAVDTVEVNYRGKLLDGTQFEDTYKTGEPVTIKISDPHVIAGLREALRLMPPGSRWELFIPSRLAYGQRSVGRLIGPYSMLIFDLELLNIR